MATRTLRARVRGSRLVELDEDIDLPVGTSVTLAIDPVRGAALGFEGGRAAPEPPLAGRGFDEDDE